MGLAIKLPTKLGKNNFEKRRVKKCLLKPKKVQNLPVTLPNFSFVTLKLVALIKINI